MNEGDLRLFAVTELLSSQYHRAVAGGCGAYETNYQRGFAPTRYRAVVLTVYKIVTCESKQSTKTKDQRR